jgi:hypothetical protein
MSHILHQVFLKCDIAYNTCYFCGVPTLANKGKQTYENVS